MLKDIKGAIFDLDGTLVDSLGVWSEFWKEFSERFFEGKPFAPTDEEEKAVRTKTIRASMDYIYSIYKIGSGGEELYDIVMSVLMRFYEEKAELKDGIKELLEYLKSKGIKMCIASATDKEYIKVAVRHCGIEEYFSDILSCADIGKGKDKPDIYLKAAETLGIKPEESCVFEDSHVAIETADKIGMKTVGIFDKYNFGQEEMKKIATAYIDEGESTVKLIEKGLI